MKKIFFLYAILLVAGILLVTATAYERIVWGGFLPGTGPNRIDFDGRRYYPGAQKPIKDSEMRLMIQSYYWGHGLYVLKSDYRTVGVEHKYPIYMQVFMKNSGNDYTSFPISGGP